MAVVDIPRNCSHLSLFKALGDDNLLGGKWNELILRIPEGCFISSSAIAFLACWGLYCCEQGKPIKFIGDTSIQRYLSRMDLFTCIGFEYKEKFIRHKEYGRFIPVKLVAEDQDVLATSNAICDLVLRNFDNGREFIPAIEWAVFELIDNIHLHSETPVPGAISAQFFPNRHRIDIGICDIGRGIKESLGEVLDSGESHAGAIAKAIQRGVTRDTNIGQGNGLTGSIDITRINGGVFNLWSGDANYSVRYGKEESFQPLPLTPGTGLFISLDTRRPVNLGDTFIGKDSWGYIDVLTEQVEDHFGRIIVADECAHLGSRNAARSLRRKVEAVFPDLTVPVILDFDGVEGASSSFLDELVGRLVDSLGVDEFNRNIRIANSTEMIGRMINVVVHQRLENPM